MSNKYSWILGCFLLAFASLASAQQTQNICSSVQTPVGWVTIHIFTDFSQCSVIQNNVKTVEKIDTLPTDATLSACNNGDPLPAGWVITDFATSASDCGGFSGDQEALRNTNGDALGAQLQVCNQSSPIPTGWTVIGVGTDFARCSKTSQDILTIRRDSGQDLSISVTPSSQPVAAGSVATYTVNINRIGGLTGNVTLSTNAIGNGITTSFNPNNTTAASSTLSVSTSATTPLNAYSITITAVDGVFTRHATVSLSVVGSAISTEHVFYIGPELHVHELLWSGGQWFHNDLNAEWGGTSAASGSKLAGFVFTPSGSSPEMNVFYLGTDQHVHLLQWSNNAWFATDVNAAAGGAPLTASGSALTGFVFTPTGSTAQMHVFYFGADQHVHELLWVGSWFHNDLTTEWGGALPATDSSLTGYPFLPSGNGNTNQMHIFYFSANQHINEMLWANNAWSANDLSAVWGGALPVTGSALHGFTFVPSGASNQMHNFYFASDQHVHELLQNQGWFPEDITGAWGGNLAGSGSGLTGFTFAPPGNNLQMHVYYLGTDSHINELLWVNNTWAPGDLTLSWGGPSAALGSALTGFVFTPPGSIAEMRVYSVASDLHVHELAWAPGSWTPSDITVMANAPTVNPGTSLLGFTF